MVHSWQWLVTAPDSKLNNYAQSSFHLFLPPASLQKLSYPRGGKAKSGELRDGIPRLVLLFTYPWPKNFWASESWWFQSAAWKASGHIIANFFTTQGGIRKHYAMLSRLNSSKYVNHFRLLQMLSVFLIYTMCNYIIYSIDIIHFI